MADVQARGLSPSGLSTFQACARKYYHYKVARTPIDADAEEDTEALRVGSAFHKCLENVNHDLTGLRFGDVVKTAAEFGIEGDLVYMLFAMLASYKPVHEASGLKVVGCETLIETETFYGFVDAVMAEKDGGWWIVDMKTAASLSPMLMPTLLSHPQLNAYAAHAHVLALIWKLDLSLFRGCRYRLTTKSKLIRKSTEVESEYLGRLGKAIKSYDFLLPKDEMQPGLFLKILERAKAKIDAAKGAEDFEPNFNNCIQYYRPCPYWSNCHKKTFTELSGR